MKKHLFNFFMITAVTVAVKAQDIKNNPGSNHGNKFEQLGTILSDANVYRTASGAPGHKYWQQKADYDIDVKLNEKELRIDGFESITYYNNSPEPLNYIWLNIDENQHDPNAESLNFDENNVSKRMTDRSIDAFNQKKLLEKLGVKIVEVKDALGAPLKYIINYTLMRVDLPKPLKPGTSVKFSIKWHYIIPDRMTVGGRGGYEFFPEDGNHLFTITQWYPRVAVYSDYQGWNNKQFTGRGEFAQTFGKYKVKITVPSDHIVGATGVCLNYAQVLSPERLARWQNAQTTKEPIEIVTLEEAVKAEKEKSNTVKTWIFAADSVRDFAWTSSRKYVWDAMPVTISGKKIMCMSFYGKEAYGLYRNYSTKVVAHTIKTYSKFTIPYPYPVAQSVEASSGMEYPMICFNFGRTEKDGTYNESTKYGMIGVIIHEVGHNFFPMIVNSDERQWSWMDEGLNTFVQFLTEQEFDNNYPSRRGPAKKITDYMSLPKDQLEPIMTNSENIIQFGSNAYGKAATGLNILRETIMGRELFDYAFKEYAKRWAFKHPRPDDFFRTMEDASGVDLDWFWRGWFYGIEPVDISLDTVKVFTVGDSSSAVKPFRMRADTSWSYINSEIYFDHISKRRNKESGMKFLVDTDTTLRDYYYYNKGAGYRMVPESQGGMKPASDSMINAIKGKYFYELQFSNKGGLVMPIIIQWNYKDGTSEVEYISAYIWRKDEFKVTKAFMKDKEVASIVIDPYLETADIDTKNNQWPMSNSTPSKFELYKTKNSARGQSEGKNPMQLNKKGK